MKNLTDREQNIVMATIRLWNVNAETGFVPDYELMESPFDLPTEVKRDIRDLVQDIRPRTFTPNASGEPEKMRKQL